VQDTSGQSVKVSVVGASGYTGAELLRLLSKHPHVEVVSITSRKFSGKRLKDVFPHLSGSKFASLPFSELDAESVGKGSDVVFCCLPHAASFPVVKEIFESSGARIVDFSADFRFRNPETYERTYGVEHGAKELFRFASYGLPELNREEIRRSRIVANPGCYPTSVILALLPAVKSELIDRSFPVVADSKSGVTGAGRKEKLELLFCEVNESFKAYALKGHRHAPEISEKLGIDNLRFIPHLVPMSRGILSTVYFKTQAKGAELAGIYEEFYRDEPFVAVSGKPPSTSDVRGTNCCRLFIVKDERTGLATVISVIDNIGKGASGQAVQNFNVMFGFDERTGLNQIPLWP